MKPPPSLPAWSREARAIVRLAAPLALTHLSYMAIMLTDVVMMGWIGTEAIAAGALARDLFWVLGAFALGVLTGATPIMAQHLGARRYRGVRPAVRNAAWLALALTIPISVASWYSSPILVLLGQEQQVADAGQSYLRYLLWGLLPSLWFAVLTELLAAHARPRAVYVVTLAGIALNALLDYALMFGNFGAPNMGLRGAGVASLVVNWCMFLALAGFVLSDRQFRRYHLLGRLWRMERPVMAEIIRIGSPIAVTEIAEMGMFFVTTLMMGLLGVDALAAHAVTAQCYAFVFMIPVGLAQAAAVRVGRAAGARDAARLARSGWTATALAGLAVLLPCVVFWFAARPVAGPDPRPGRSGQRLRARPGGAAARRGGVLHDRRRGPDHGARRPPGPQGHRNADGDRPLHHLGRRIAHRGGARLRPRPRRAGHLGRNGGRHDRRGVAPRQAFPPAGATVHGAVVTTAGPTAS